MTCQRCNSSRILNVSSKVSDRFFAQIGSKEHSGYVPGGIGLDGGDYMAFAYCLDCGQIQDHFPMPMTEMEIK